MEENTCEIPEEPDFHTVTLYEEFAFMSHHKQEQYQTLKTKLASWETIFFLPLPKDPLVDNAGLDLFVLESPVRLSKDGGFKWTKGYLRTENGILGIYESKEKSDLNHPITAEKMLFSVYYEQYLLIKNQPLCFPSHPIIRFFTDKGSFDVLFSDPSHVDAWRIALARYWKSVLPQEHWVAKRDTIKEYVTIIQQIKDLCLDKYTHYHHWFLHHRSNKFSKIYAGNLSVHTAGSWVTLEVELFHGCVVMDYSGGDKKTRKRFLFALLRFFHLLDEGDDKRFYLVSPKQKLLVEAKNPQSKKVWMEYFKTASGDIYKDVEIPSRTNGETTTLPDISSSHHQREEHSISKPTDLPEVVLLDPVSQVLHNLKRDGITTIGRSRSNFICIKNDKVSRFHAKIEFLNGVPVITELGSTRGIRVNGTTVTKCALKTGDTLDIAGVCTLEVH